ncbi:MAG: triose-phosphate isomerase [Desulfurococcaceae archaeon]|nr:triose-phosphate isomerase [Desulfurococcaceae archaeon]
MIKTPVIVINYKVYNTSFGNSALSIAKAAEEVSINTGVNIIVAPPATEIRTLASNVSIPVYAQHVDPVDLGAYTGHIPPEAVKEAGAKGFIINHSERRIRVDEIARLVIKARNLGLNTLVCADTPEVAAALAVLNPDMIAIEPPELIGTGIAVSKAKPEIILSTVSRIRSVNNDVIILTGAGISTPEDVVKALELGTSGVLISSAIMKAKDPKKVINEMAEAVISRK